MAYQELSYEEELNLSEKLELRLEARSRYDKDASLEDMEPGDREAVEAGNRAAQDLVEAYLPFIRSMAHTVYRSRDLWRTGYASVEDLIQTGVVAAMTCTNRFSAKKGRRFSTYAEPHIRKSIGLSIDKASTPFYAQVAVLQESNKWFAIQDRLRNELGREPTEQEMDEAFPQANFDLIADIPKGNYLKDVDSPSLVEKAQDNEFELAFDLDFHTARLRQGLLATGVNEHFIEGIIMYFGCDRGYPRDIAEFAEKMEMGPRNARDFVDLIQNYVVHPRNRVIMQRYLVAQQA